MLHRVLKRRLGDPDVGGRQTDEEGRSNNIEHQLLAVADKSWRFEQGTPARRTTSGARCSGRPRVRRSPQRQSARCQPNRTPRRQRRAPWGSPLVRGVVRPRAAHRGGQRVQDPAPGRFGRNGRGGDPPSTPRPPPPGPIDNVVANAPRIPQLALDRDLCPSEKGDTADPDLKGNLLELRIEPIEPTTLRDRPIVLGEDGHAESKGLIDTAGRCRLMLEGDEQERGIEGHRAEPRRCQPAAPDPAS